MYKEELSLLKAQGQSPEPILQCHSLRGWCWLVHIYFVSIPERWGQIVNKSRLSKTQMGREIKTDLNLGLTAKSEILTIKGLHLMFFSILSMYSEWSCCGCSCHSYS